jgi:hypothetical protein
MNLQLNLQLLKPLLAIAIVFTGGLGLHEAAIAQDLDRARPSSAIPTVEDAPQGEVDAIENIPPLFLPTTSSPVRNTLPLDVTTPNEPYIVYPNTVFERLIGEDHLKLRFSVQSDRDGANLGVGLPLR